MQQALRPYATAGIALVGGSVIAVTPVVPQRLPGLFDIHAKAVQLTAGESLGDVLREASTNAKTLADNFLLAPSVGFQQEIVALAGLFQQAASDPTFDLAGALSTNLQDISAAVSLQQPTGLDDDAFADVVSAVTPHTLTGGLGHSLFINPAILGLFLDPDQVGQVLPILHFLSSPFSGVLMGFMGPFIAPFVALVNAISAGDDFGAILASPLDGFLNGATLDLTSLASLIPADTLPDGVSIDALSLAFGGLLSPGTVSAGDNGVYTDINGDTVTPVGGSILNSVGIDIDNPTLPLSIAGEPVGPIGAAIGLQQAVGAALGMDWDGKNAVAQAPLIGLKPFDDSGLKELLESLGSSGTTPDPAGAVDGLGQVITDLLSGNWDQAFSDVF